MSFVTVSQSYIDNEWVIMKVCAIESRLRFERFPPVAALGPIDR